MDMDMPKHKGTPWLDQPVMLHSSRASTCKLTPEQCAYRNAHWRNWFISDHVYALGTIYFLCATLGVFVISRLISKYAPSAVKESRFWRKQEAAVRFFAYRGFQLPALRYWSPSLGVGFLLIAGVIFFFAMTLGPRPYYWPDAGKVNYGNSPPIATRTGWMALAMLPFLLALSAKANLISALTGVSHAKLQVFHQWIGYAMFVLGLIHTFPFIVYNIQKGDMVKQWKTQVTYWTGVVTLIFQAYLTFMSIPSIRKRFYEFFKATHFLAALAFVLFFFFHCDFRLSSWDYFIAAGSIYIFSLLAAQFRTYLMHGVHHATIDVLPCGFIRVRIPTVSSWQPGQHVFLRFFALGLHSLTAHPFTICSLSHDPDRIGRAPEMIFYIKPRDGITARLAKLGTKSPGLTKTVLLEGPYGGLDLTSPGVGRFDKVLVIAGGSGAGFSLAVIEEALRHRQLITISSEKGYLPCRNIQIIFATRNAAVAKWYMESVESLLSAYSGLGETSVSIYITSSAPESQPNQLSLEWEQAPSTTEIPEDKKDSSSPGLATGTPSSSLSSDQYDYNRHNHNKNNNSNNNTKSGVDIHKLIRPNLPEFITTATNSGDSGMGFESGKRIGIFTCGPVSMLHDVRNSAAQAQSKVLKGEDIREVYLHSETFWW